MVLDNSAIEREKKDQEKQKKKISPLIAEEFRPILSAIGLESIRLPQRSPPLTASLRDLPCILTLKPRKLRNHE